MTKPLPINLEIKLDPKKYIVSKTDTNGIIEYGNDYFVKISGYKESELLRQPHSIIRHPDMPKIIFKMMWERLQNGENILALVKNLSKDGRYYWVITEFEPKIDSKTKETLAYTAFRKAAPQKAIDAIVPLYEKLVEIETTSDIITSEKYLYGYLEEMQIEYDDYIDNIVENRGLFKIFFKSMKKFFS